MARQFEDRAPMATAALRRARRGRRWPRDATSFQELEPSADRGPARAAAEPAKSDAEGWAGMRRDAW